jgi:hypothetical protein
VDLLQITFAGHIRERETLRDLASRTLSDLHVHLGSVARADDLKRQIDSSAPRDEGGRRLNLNIQAQTAGEEADR